MKAIKHKAGKRILAILACMALAFGPIGSLTVNAEPLTGYNPDAAVSYAKNTSKNYKDCIKFAIACAKKGGVPVQKDKKNYSAVQYMDYLTTYGYAVKHQLTTCADTYVPLNGVNKIGNLRYEDNKGKVARGDILVYYCNSCHKYFHMAVVTDIAEGKDDQQHYWMLCANSANGKVIKNQPFYLYSHKSHGRNNVTVYSLHFTSAKNGFTARGERVSGLTAKKVSKSKARLTWTPVPGAVAYNIYVRTSSKASFEFVKQVNVTDVRVLIPKKSRSNFKNVRYTVAPVMPQQVNFDGTVMNYNLVARRSAFAKIKKK